ncbi:MAG: tRNA (adenosine(37)-N6)-dimethylallyltransferase MiaA [Patescibacteria group bacterium]|nr:tRNA (adenosine(37)-N6)-dimethylallyltransferase MiaA [Patescibacteria group bacterium]
MNKIIVILGQTSTGKSDFAVKLAKKIDGEIISADSRQVYKGLDLGTGKITEEEMQDIPHYLLDIISPKKVFSVSDYKKLAEEKIEDILERKKIPIICGGTGFYIDSITEGIIYPEVPPNKELRKELQKKSLSELQKILEELDLERFKEIDVNNKVRLIRAIEIVESIGKVPKLKKNKKYDALKIGLTLPDKILKERIYKRLINRINQGMIEEIKDLYNKDILSYNKMHKLGLEYRYVGLHLQDKLSKEEMIKKLNTEIWHFAKRQKIWFKRDKNIIWINPTKEIPQKYEINLKSFLKK